MKITAVILLYALFFAGDRGQGRLKTRLWILIPLLIFCLALSMGLDVPTMNNLFAALKGGM